MTTAHIYVCLVVIFLNWLYLCFSFYKSTKSYKEGIPLKNFRFGSDQIKRQTLLGKLPFVNCSMSHHVVIQFSTQQMSECRRSTVQTKTSTKLSINDPKILAAVHF